MHQKATAIDKKEPIRQSTIDLDWLFKSSDSNLREVEGKQETHGEERGRMPFIFLQKASGRDRLRLSWPRALPCCRPRKPEGPWLTLAAPRCLQEAFPWKPVGQEVSKHSSVSNWPVLILILIIEAGNAARVQVNPPEGR